MYLLYSKSEKKEDKLSPYIASHPPCSPVMAEAFAALLVLTVSLNLKFVLFEGDALWSPSTI